MGLKKKKKNWSDILKTGMDFTETGQPGIKDFEPEKLFHMHAKINYQNFNFDNFDSKHI